MKTQIILASGSARRRELMDLMGLEFEVEVSEADEHTDNALSPDELVRVLSCRKAKAVFEKHKDACVIGSDTVVVYDNLVLGKPRDEADARRMLKMLSGKTHTVYTGIAVIREGLELTACDATSVTFTELTDREIDDYIKSGDPVDKAGAYGIQGKFCVHIERIEGSFFSVMGLPVHKLYSMLKDCGIEF